MFTGFPNPCCFYSCLLCLKCWDLNQKVPIPSPRPHFIYVDPPVRALSALPLPWGFSCQKGSIRHILKTPPSSAFLLIKILNSYYLINIFSVLSYYLHSYQPVDAQRSLRSSLWRHPMTNCFGCTICFTASYKLKSLSRITNHSSYSTAIIAVQTETVILLEALDHFNTR